MTIEARLPDGRVLRFPDGTDPAVIQNTVKRVLRAGNVPPIPDPRGIPQPRRTTGRGLAEVAFGAAEMAPLGFGAEIGAGVETALGQMGIGGFSPRFAENLEQTERILEQSDPAARAIGNVLGAVPAGFAFSAPTSVAQAARQGAVLGAGFGAGSAEGGLPERAMSAGIGAVTGGAGGAAGQAIIQGIGRAIANARTGLDRRTRAAMDRVLAELREGNITPQQAITRVQRLGPEGMLADVPELQGLAGSAATQTAAGGRIAQSALTQRAQGAGQRVDDALDIALQGRNTRQIRQAIQRSRAAEAQDLYERALSQGPLQRTEALEALIGTPGVKGSGSNLVRGQIASIRRSNPKFRDLPDNDPNLLHAVRVALADRSKGQGAAKRNINDIVQQLTDAMESSGAQGYRQAVDQYRTDSLVLDAFDQGRKSLNALPEDIDTFLQQASQAEQESFVAGLGREVVRRMTTGETGVTSRNVRSILSGERAQVLRRSLGDDAYDQLVNRLLREIRFTETAGRVRGGSMTQPRQAAERDIAQRMGRVRRVGEAIRGGRGSLAALAESVVGSRSPAARVGEEQALAQILFRSQGQGLAPGRFEGRTPLLELALRQRLLQGAGRLTAPARQPAVGAAGGLAGLAAQNNPFANDVGF